MKPFKFVEDYIRTHLDQSKVAHFTETKKDLANKILVDRNIFVSEREGTPEEVAYTNAFLYCRYGITVSEPKKLNYDVLKQVSASYKLEVPASFYANPQDIKNYSAEELFVNQVVAYFSYGTEAGNVRVIDKDLPALPEGTERVERTFKILTPAEAIEEYKHILKSYASYKKGYGNNELEEVKFLIESGFYDVKNPVKFESKDNVGALLTTKFETFSVEDMSAFRKSLVAGGAYTTKDIPDLSIKLFGATNDRVSLKDLMDKNPEGKQLIKDIIEVVPSQGMSNKQIKFFNKICKVLEIKGIKPTVEKRTEKSNINEKIIYNSAERNYKHAKTEYKLEPTLENYEKMLETLNKPGDYIRHIRESVAVALEKPTAKETAKEKIERQKNELQKVELCLDRIPEANLDQLLQAKRFLTTDKGIAGRTFKYFDKVKKSYVMYSEKPQDIFVGSTKVSKDRWGRATKTFEPKFENDEKITKRNIISKDLGDIIKTSIMEKIEATVEKYDKIGKIYIDSALEKMAIPENTSASGRGIGITTPGSRIPFEKDFVRTYVRWEKAFDIDLSVAVLTEKEFNEKNFESNRSDTWSRNRDFKFIYYGNYYGKPFGNAILHSGDITGSKGTEFVDIDLPALEKQGYKYAVITANGYGSSFDSGDINCGIGFKDNINTRAWDAKNIFAEMNVNGVGRGVTSFVIDIPNREYIPINLRSDQCGNIIEGNQIEMCRNFVSQDKVEFNFATLLERMGERVDKPEDADVVFSSNYQPLEYQVAVRPERVEDMVAILNGKPIDTPKEVLEARAKRADKFETVKAVFEKYLISSKAELDLELKQAKKEKTLYAKSYKELDTETAKTDFETAQTKVKELNDVKKFLDENKVSDEDLEKALRKDDTSTETDVEAEDKSE